MGLHFQLSRKFIGSAWEPTKTSTARNGKMSTHYTDVIMGAIASQITSLTIVYSTFYSDADKNIKAPRHWPLCGEFTGEFPAQMASNAENVSIWWRHHETETLTTKRRQYDRTSIFPNVHCPKCQPTKLSTTRNVTSQKRWHTKTPTDLNVHKYKFV